MARQGQDLLKLIAGKTPYTVKAASTRRKQDLLALLRPMQKSAVIVTDQADPAAYHNDVLRAQAAKARAYDEAARAEYEASRRTKTPLSSEEAFKNWDSNRADRVKHYTQGELAEHAKNYKGLGTIVAGSGDEPNAVRDYTQDALNRMHAYGKSFTHQLGNAGRWAWRWVNPAYYGDSPEARAKRRDLEAIKENAKRQHSAEMEAIRNQLNYGDWGFDFANGVAEVGAGIAMTGGVGGVGAGVVKGVARGVGGTALRGVGTAMNTAGRVAGTGVTKGLTAAHVAPRFANAAGNIVSNGISGMGRGFTALAKPVDAISKGVTHPIQAGRAIGRLPGQVWNGTRQLVNHPIQTAGKVMQNGQLIDAAYYVPNTISGVNDLAHGDFSSAAKRFGSMGMYGAAGALPGGFGTLGQLGTVGVLGY